MLPAVQANKMFQPPENCDVNGNDDHEQSKLNSKVKQQPLTHNRNHSSLNTIPTAEFKPTDPRQKFNSKGLMLTNL